MTAQLISPFFRFIGIRWFNLSSSQIRNFKHVATYVAVQPGLCGTCSETMIAVLKKQFDFDSSLTFIFIIIKVIKLVL